MVFSAWFELSSRPRERLALISGERIADHHQWGTAVALLQLLLDQIPHLLLCDATTAQVRLARGQGQACHQVRLQPRATAEHNRPAAQQAVHQAGAAQKGPAAGQEAVGFPGGGEQQRFGIRFAAEANKTFFHGVAQAWLHCAQRNRSLK